MLICYALLAQLISNSARLFPKILPEQTSTIYTHIIIIIKKIRTKGPKSIPYSFS